MQELFQFSLSETQDPGVTPPAILGTDLTLLPSEILILGTGLPVAAVEGIVQILSFKIVNCHKLGQEIIRESSFMKSF